MQQQQQQQQSAAAPSSSSSSARKRSASGEEDDQSSSSKKHKIDFSSGFASSSFSPAFPAGPTFAETAALAAAGVPDPTEASDDEDMSVGVRVLEAWENKPSSSSSSTPTPWDADAVVDEAVRAARATVRGTAVGAEARRTLEALLWPLSVDEFEAEVMDRQVLLIRRSPLQEGGSSSSSSSAATGVYQRWLDRAGVLRMVDEFDMRYGRDLNVARYKDGQRTTLDPVGERATRESVEQFLADGCSIRLLCPQRYLDGLWEKLSLLEEHLGSGVGCNVYLTPTKTQGFAPHFDDIDAFVMQSEGRKHWRVYAPRNASEHLARFSSPNFAQSEIGEPVLDTVLQPGDLLYMPRGFIHQAVGAPGSDYSLHLTVSASQVNSFHDLIQGALPVALEAASAQNSRVRRSLPRDYFDYMGVVHEDNPPAGLGGRREAFQRRVGDLLELVLDAFDVDTAADEMAKRHMHNRLPVPPRLRPLSGKELISPHAAVRLSRPNVARLVLEDGQAIVYHCLNNSRLYHEKEPQGVAFPAEDAPALELLLKAFPHWLPLAALRELVERDDDMAALLQEMVALLVDQGVLVCR